MTGKYDFIYIYLLSRSQKMKRNENKSSEAGISIFIAIASICTRITYVCFTFKLLLSKIKRETSVVSLVKIYNNHLFTYLNSIQRNGGMSKSLVAPNLVLYLKPCLQISRHRKLRVKYQPFLAQHYGRNIRGHYGMLSKNFC